MRTTPLILLTLCVATLAACSDSSPPDTSAPTAQVTTRAATTGDLPVVVHGFGLVEFDPAQLLTLNTEIEARVLELGARAGESVDKGRTLLKLAPSRAARLDLERARRDARTAADAAARAERLRADGLASDADVEAAQGTARDQAATLASLEARAQSLADLKAPSAGVVDALLVRPGDLVAPGTALVRLAQPDALQARISIEPEDAALLGRDVAIRLTGLNHPDQQIDTRLRILDRRLDPTTRMTTAWADLPAGSGFLTGESVRAQLTAEVHRDVVIVPRSAVFHDANGAYLFLDEGGKAQLRRIETGITNGERTEIRSGVRPGDTVIVEGAAVLSDGMDVRTTAPRNAGDRSGDRSGDSSGDSSGDGSGSASGNSGSGDASSAGAAR